MSSSLGKKSEVEIPKLFGLSKDQYLSQYHGLLLKERYEKLGVHFDKKEEKIPLVSDLKKDIEQAKFDLDNEKVFSLHIILGKEYLRQCQYGDAESTFKASLNYVGNDIKKKIEGHYNLVRTYILAKDFNNVIAESMDLVAILNGSNNENAEISKFKSFCFCCAGIAYFCKNNFSKAADNFLKVQQKNDNKISEVQEKDKKNVLKVQKKDDNYFLEV